MLVKKFVVRYTAVIPFSFYIDSKLPIVLFVGQHFSGSLFYTMVLYIGGCKRSLSLAADKDDLILRVKLLQRYTGI